jgi:hypothetical protein
MVIGAADRPAAATSVGALGVAMEARPALPCSGAAPAPPPQAATTTDTHQLFRELRMIVAM